MICYKGKATSSRPQKEGSNYRKQLEELLEEPRRALPQLFLLQYWWVWPCRRSLAVASSFVWIRIRERERERETHTHLHILLLLLLLIIIIIIIMMIMILVMWLPGRGPRPLARAACLRTRGNEKMESLQMILRILISTFQRWSTQTWYFASDRDSADMKAPKGDRHSTICLNPQWKLCLSSAHLCSGSPMVWQSTPKIVPRSRIPRSTSHFSWRWAHQERYATDDAIRIGRLHVDGRSKTPSYTSKGKGRQGIGSFVRYS